MHEPFASSLGTTGLLKHLEIALSSVQKFNDISNPENEAADLVEKLNDLIDVTSSLDDVATRERRGSSIYLKSVSATDLVHLHSICACTATLIHGCNDDIESLHSSLGEILHTRSAIGYVTTENRLGNQAWYDETYQILNLYADILRILYLAINLLYRKNDTDEDGNLSSEAASHSSSLQYRIALV